ncbi:MAG: hypothetical protein HUJ53_08255 [Holdemanella sp.]|nr:hypothetical protein [Holdemanella sp.]
MTNKEKYKQAFSVIKPSGEIHLEVEKMQSTKHSFLKPGLAIATCCILLLGGGITAYANNVGNIQRMIQIWIHGDQTKAVFEVNPEEGTYSLDYTDENGQTKHQSGGGIAFNEDGSQRPVTEQEILDEINAPKIEYKEDGSVWMYYMNQSMDITSMFEDDVCYIQIMKDGKPLYMTIKYKNGYATSPDRYLSPSEFN